MFVEGGDNGFLYSQDLSNCKTGRELGCNRHAFLYSQDLSNCKTFKRGNGLGCEFLYSQDLSNCKTDRVETLESP